MSLLDSAFELCTMIDHVYVPDGQGGGDYVWTDGAQFEAAIVFNSSIQAKVAEKQGVTALYTVTTRKNVGLLYRQVFRRESDKATFRITSDGTDNKTPKGAGLNMRNYNAERYELTESENE